MSCLIDNIIATCIEYKSSKPCLLRIKLDGVGDMMPIIFEIR